MSKSIGPKAAAMSTYDKEALAILKALKRWKHYFANNTLIIKTDQQSLKYIHEQRLTEGIQHKLLIKLLGFDYKIEYRQGKTNRAADALSRVQYDMSTMPIATVVPTWIPTVTDTYTTDPKCTELIAALSVNADSIPHHTLTNGVLRYKGKIIAGSDVTLKTQLITAFHKSELGGHSVERATYQRLQIVFH